MLDNFEGYLSSELKSSINKLNYDIETLPAKTTKFLQPLDLGVNRPFKKYISEEWEEYAARLTQKDTTKSGYYKAPTRGIRMLRVSRAWNKIKKETNQGVIIVLYLNCRISRINLLILTRMKKIKMKPQKFLVKKVITSLNSKISQKINIFRNQWKFKVPKKKDPMRQI